MHGQHHHWEEPFKADESLRLHISSPFTQFNPTHAKYQHVFNTNDTDFPGHRLEYLWTSRNNRKGRHQLISPKEDSLAPTSSIGEVIRNIGRMFTQYPFYDVSWLVAYGFTLGSVIWVFNAFFVWLPIQKPSTEFQNEILYVGGITAFIGATIFWIFSIFLMLEAINENRTGCFGWAVEQVLEDEKIKLHVHPDPLNCKHHHQNHHNLLCESSNPQNNQASSNVEAQTKARPWRWCPSWSDLRHRLVFEISFIACSFQMAGATIFWISGFTALPGILNHLSRGLEDGIYWAPQVVGGCGFIISGTLFMLETQECWYKPALGVLGWHIGFWNTIGGLGFTLCPAFGYDPAEWSQYQASLSSFWGSWAFLIGSLIQLYESLQKYPVDHLKEC
ncbi:hypothetical protein EJ08DRAFT_115436 [Tothia fuscella]|uniref:Integral membrane protein n=1 Tax=Tothia fuscella TaxID=1048955 RepID=A0A9P4NX45_9PEZI|nr:hypothetical protein EJ08DRAFT_115436 [Tothia fuscella]